MDNFDIWQRSQGRAAMIGFWALCATYIYATYVVQKVRKTKQLLVTKVYKVMGDLAPVNEISPFIAILWVFYPMAALVLIELLLRAFSNDDDDDSQGGKMIPAAVPSA